MKIAIIGHGNVGGALAKNWAKSGHNIIIGTRKAQDEKAAQLVAEHELIKTAPIQEVVATADTVLVATPPQVATALARSWGTLPGKVIIDATNAIWQQPEGYDTAYNAFADITKAEVVKAFNTTGFENMENPQYGETTADMFVAGDSETAKEMARKLANEAGFERVYDFGGGDKVKALEHFAFAWINLAIMQGEGRNMAFKVLKK